MECYLEQRLCSRTWIVRSPITSAYTNDTYQFFPTEKVIVVLRDGRNLIGYLRSVDQFANLVLHRTIERIHVKNKYGDIPRGVFIVRGENVALLGEIVQITIFQFGMKFLMNTCNLRTWPKKRSYLLNKWMLKKF